MSQENVEIVRNLYEPSSVGDWTWCSAMRTRTSS